MHVVRFTKFWGTLSVQEMGERAARLEYDGLDLAVRAGHAVHPGNVETELSRAVSLWRSMGVSCSLISAEVSLADATAESARRLFAAAAEAGVPAIKIGYFTYEPGTDFEPAWVHAKHRLEGFEALSRDTGVRTLYHTHSGLCLGSNCAGVRHLLDGFDPMLVGAYVDLGHLAVNGEDVNLGLPMLRERLAAVSAKDARHVPDARSDRRAAYADGFVPLGEGASELADAVRLLHQWQFTSPVSVHTEYTSDRDVIATVGGWEDSPEAAAMRDKGEVEDLRYLRELWRQCGG